jgi:hypothetical protein
LSLAFDEGRKGVLHVPEARVRLRR